MVIALAAPAVLFLIGLSIMIRNEEKSTKRDESVAPLSRKRP